MAERAKHAFGTSENLQNALNSGVIDAYDILFLDGDTDPKVGWVDKNGVVRMVENGTDVDLSGIESELATKANAEEVETQLATKANAEEVETQLATKADAKEVDAKIDEIETALDGVANASYTHEKVKYEIADVPVGTLVDYSDKEIRVMCPKDTAFTKQTVGNGGDSNAYYMTFKTYVYNDNVVGYREHLGDQVDSETLTDLKTDEYGRRYQPTWLALAKYDEATDTWTYYGANSDKKRYIGWDYQIDWYNADGVVIASDSVRINLSNENCHSTIEPYYVNTIETKLAEMETKIEEVSAYEIVEF